MALIVFFFLATIFSISLGETDSCNEGWSFFNGNCYKAILPKTGLTFDEASNQCQQVGCELASIHSKAENDFIIDLIHKESVKVKPCYYFWLGLKMENKIPKIWTDGTTVDFGKTDITPWDKGEPNDANPQENCVVMYGYSEALGKWSDLSCDKVDEWEAISGMMSKIFCMLKANTNSPDLKHKTGHMASWKPSDYEANLIKQTWSDSFEDLHKLGSMIYVYIFANNPHVKALFPSIHKHGENWQNSKEFHAQSLKFAQVLASVIENIYRIDHVKQLLFNIGAKHVEFAKRGFRPDYWDIFQEGMAICMVEKINSMEDWDKFQKISAVAAWKNLALFIIENFKIGYSMKENDS